MRKVMAIALAAGLFCVTTANADILYDRSISIPPEPTNGYSNTDGSAGFGPRFLLDDFSFSGPDWVLQDFHWKHIWNTAQPGSGTGMVLEIWSDNGGAPGGPIASANITSYQEMSTGETAFSRPVAESWVTFDDIQLSAGTYWFYATIVGPENNFWLLNDTPDGNEAWVDYADLGGLQPGSAIFGAPADLNFVLTGFVIPEPGTLSVLALGSVALIGFRRRRS